MPRASSIMIYTALQGQKAVSAYLYCEQIRVLPFGFAQQNTGGWWARFL